MKITLYGRGVDNDVWVWARERAKRDRVSLSRVVVDALRSVRRAEAGRRGRAVEGKGGE